MVMYPPEKRVKGLSKQYHHLDGISEETKILQQQAEIAETELFDIVDEMCYELGIAIDDWQLDGKLLKAITKKISNNITLEKFEKIKMLSLKFDNHKNLCTLLKIPIAGKYCWFTNLIQTEK